MRSPFVRLLLSWALNTLVLWVSGELFAGVRFDTPGALVVSGLLFSVAHAVLKPVLVILTLPITVVTLGLFLLVINGVLLLLVAWLVPGFHVAGFWQAVLVGLFISIFSFVLNLATGART